MQDFRQLQVWEKAHQLTLAVYRVTRSFPREELYGLTAQPRRSSCSIPANLAEGCGRGGDAEFSRFCRIAMGSARELDYHLSLARDLALIAATDHGALATQLDEVKAMLSGLMQRLKADS